ncbi:MAG: hypothetical protein AXA67_10965 [Methylothermaceae bacteria B42]|nr:MAG: hypothetical protein AXA67_10965 [Methylothermaceae bacteria B42]HHJ38995.1 diguanylate cyclase [Methylothermaceae bacterium]
MMTLEDLAATLDLAPMGVLVLKDGQIAWLNQTLADLTEQPREALVGNAIGDSHFSNWFQEIVEVATTDGMHRHFRWHQAALANGSQAHYFVEITEQVSLQKTAQALETKLQALDLKDATTGLQNRRAIMQELNRQISRSRRYENPLSIIRLTLESSVEKPRQDEIMRTLSAALKDKLRWADEVGMLDDTTFLLVLPETSLEDAKELATKLLSDRAALDFSADEGKIRYGVAAWSKGDDLLKLLKRAEKDQDLNLSALLS